MTNSSHCTSTAFVAAATCRASIALLGTPQRRHPDCRGVDGDAVLSPSAVQPRLPVPAVVLPSGHVDVDLDGHAKQRATTTTCLGKTRVNIRGDNISAGHDEDGLPRHPDQKKK